MSQPSRRTARVTVFRVLYQRAKIGTNPAGEMILFREAELSEKEVNFAKTLIDKTWSELEAIDQAIQKNLKNWKQSRLADGLNALLRMALAEIFFSPKVEGKIVINDTLEICRSHVDKQAIKICNGVLNAAWKEHSPQ